MPLPQRPPFPTYVPESELERPQRDALQQLMASLAPPGLVQQGQMLQEHLRSLGPVRAAERTADDLLGVFRSLGSVGADLANPVRVGQRAGEAASGAVGGIGDRLAPGLADVAGDLREGLRSSIDAQRAMERTAAETTARERSVAGYPPPAQPGEPQTQTYGADQDERGQQIGQDGRHGSIPPGATLALPTNEAAPYTGESRPGPVEAFQRGAGRTVGDVGRGLGRIGENVPAAYAATRRGDLPGLAGSAAQAGLGGVEAATAPLNLGGNFLAEVLRQEGLSPEVADAVGLGLTFATTGGPQAVRELLEGASRVAGQAGRAAPGVARSASEILASLSAAGAERAAGVPGAGAVGRLLTEEGGAVRLPTRADLGALRRPTLGEASETLTSIPLSSPASLKSNLLAGGFRTFQRWAEDSAGAALVDRSFRESWDDLAAMVAELPAALRASGRSLARGPSAEAGEALAAGSLSRSTHPAARLATGGLRANAATDELYRQLNEAGALARAQRRGLSSPEQAERGVRAADFATWAGRNTLAAEALTQARAWVNDPTASTTKKVAGLALSFVAPYVRMPERVLRSGVRLTTDVPRLGLEALFNSGLAKQARAGDVEAQRELAGRLAVSALTLAAIVGGYGAKTLHGAPPRDPKARRRLEAEGARWETWGPLNLRDMGSFGLAAGIIATALQNAELNAAKGKTWDDVVRAGINGAARYIGDESYLRDFMELGTAVQEEGFEQAGERTLIRGAGRVLAPVTSAVAALDPSEREVRGAQGELLRNLPGGRFALPERIDPATGRPVQRTGNAVTRLLGERDAVESPEARELARLGVSAREFKATDTPFGLPLKPEERRVLQETYGRLAGRYIRDTMARPDYQRATDAQRAATLERQLALAERLADLEVGDRVARDPEARFRLAWARTPQYRDAEGGTPDQIARKNLEIAQAKQLLADYERRYGRGEGRDRLERLDPRLVELAMSRAIPERYLAEERALLRKRLGLPAQGEEDDAALLGAGRRVLPDEPAPIEAPQTPAWVLERERQKAAERARELAALLAPRQDAGGGGFHFTAP